jgi:hypothetical protein
MATPSEERILEWDIRFHSFLKGLNADERDTFLMSMDTCLGRWETWRQKVGTVDRECTEYKRLE